MVPLPTLGWTAEGEPEEGRVALGWARRVAVPATPGWEVGGGFLTTTCGVPGSPTPLSLKEKWAMPLRGWVYTTLVPR